LEFCLIGFFGGVFFKEQETTFQKCIIFSSADLLQEIYGVCREDTKLDEQVYLVLG